MTLPLLIGGATTSPQHTAVKIAPEYSQPTVHVPDASRVVDVVASLLSADNRSRRSTRRTAPHQAKLREQHAGRKDRPIAVARAGARQSPEARLLRARPCRRSPACGRSTSRSTELVPFIDWQFFFTAWELKGRFPRFSTTRRSARPRTDLYDHAQKLLKQIVDGKLIRARGVYGFWPANSDGDDIVLWTAIGAGTAEEGRGAVPDAAAAGSDRRRQAESIARRLRRADRQRRHRLHRRICGDRRHRRRRARQEVRSHARRLLRHHRQGAGRSAGRGVRRVSARAGAQGLGLRRRAVERRPDRREVSAASARRSAIRRAPITARRRGCSICSARASAGPRSDRIVRDDAGGVGQRPLLLSSAVEVLRDPAHRPGSGRGLREAQGHERRPKSSAGCARCSPTIRRWSARDL